MCLPGGHTGSSSKGPVSQPAAAAAEEGQPSNWILRAKMGYRMACRKSTYLGGEHGWQVSRPLGPGMPMVSDGSLMTECAGISQGPSTASFLAEKCPQAFDMGRVAGWVVLSAR